MYGYVSQSVRNHLLKRPPRAWIDKAHFISDNAIVYTDLYLGPVRLSLDKMEPERLLNYSLTVWWSKKGKKLAFLSKDKVEENSMLMVSYTDQGSYPSVIQQKCTKTNEKQIPAFILFVWDKETRELKQMDVKLRNRTAYHYPYGVQWVVMRGEEFLVTFWADRLQTHISMTICDHTSGICELMFEHEYPSKTWPEISDFSSALSSDDAIYILLPRAMPDGNSYQHIAKLTIQPILPGLYLFLKITSRLRREHDIIGKE
ncbi:hypothetical protein NECAME_11977 [Necator americanus]|uniref:Dipeptidylpeptidase IV N-terminal domain-containing protein n=1 Tax=Necator americanus TaxID=51031 RepID=W2T414_NECAM|nr:hypothetical protein NECAME_11977 [Necator americanus]ETN75981.1 hypothetical protein NECAME_11977 [Necator americanus]